MSDVSVDAPSTPIPVVVARQGAYLAPTSDVPARPLSPSDLAVLQAVAATGAAPSDDETARSLVDDLRARGLFAGDQAVTPLTTLRDQGWSGQSPAAADDTTLVLVAPVGYALTSAGFEYVDHDGVAVARFDAAEVAASLQFSRPSTRAQALARLRKDGGDDALSEEAFTRLVATLTSARLLLDAEEEAAQSAEGRQIREMKHHHAMGQKRASHVDEYLARRQVEEDEQFAATGERRAKVIPVNIETFPLLSVGMLWAYASHVDGGHLTDDYEFVADWCNRTVPNLTGDEPPAIYLFSNYLWSHAANMANSEELKKRCPNAIALHGGPNTPKYEGDVAAYFADNPHVDIAVHGEGEATFAHVLDVLRPQFRSGASEIDLSVLRDVPGLTVRVGDEIIDTGQRERIPDLDTIPSPFELGIFDSVGDEGITLSTVETNRGCPYGCTFCDWGSATLSRIRKFDLQRVFDDLEWCAKHKSTVIFLADANFGIFERDIDIAKKVVELKEQYGYPKVLESSYAKNTVKHLKHIIQIFAEGGVLSTGSLSLQSVDPDTLLAIRRKNIRVDKYDDLAGEFESLHLPLVVELMMGLPGSTASSFLGDLQQCIDRELKARVNPTEVLVNSPMNDPEYRSEHDLTLENPVKEAWKVGADYSRSKALVVSSASFTRTEYDEMERQRLLFFLFENFGVLRHVSRFVRQESGVSEMAFYGRIAADAHADRARWPMIAFTIDALTDSMMPPVSWRLFIDEVGRYLTDELGIVESSALATVLRVQHALLPARGREFPLALDLPHDYTSWYQAMLDVKLREYKADWAGEIPRLETFGPASFEVDDPQQVSELGYGMPLIHDLDSDWELGSPVARAMRYRHLVHG